MKRLQTIGLTIIVLFCLIGSWLAGMFYGQSYVYRVENFDKACTDLFCLQNLQHTNVQIVIEFHEARLWNTVPDLTGYGSENMLNDIAKYFEQFPRRPLTERTGVASQKTGTIIPLRGNAKNDKRVSIILNPYITNNIQQ